MFVSGQYTTSNKITKVDASTDLSVDSSSPLGCDLVNHTPIKTNQTSLSTDADQSGGGASTLESVDQSQLFCSVVATPLQCPLIHCKKPHIIDGDLRTHIRHRHPSVAATMNREDEDIEKPAYDVDCCYKCSIFTFRERHYSCSEPGCKSCFRSREAQENHESRVHPKPEFSCREAECPGKYNGKCSFNHDDVTDCRNEVSKDLKYCRELNCKYNHLWGRVRRVKEMKAKAKASATKVGGGGGVTSVVNG